MTLANRAQERALRLGMPFRVHLVLTHTCNLACAHCYQAEHVGAGELSTDEVKALLADLAALGVLYLVLGGGEPLARRDFWEILAEARRLKFAVTLYTNGTLIDAAVAKRIREAGVAEVSLSLHGAEARTHDAFVRRQGSFDRVQRAMDLLEAEGLPVSVKASVSKTNVREMPQLATDLSKRRLTILSTNTTLFARDDGDETPLAYRVNEEEQRRHVRAEFAAMPRAQFEALLDDARRTLAAPESLGSAPCQAARTTFAVQPNGDVTPCTQTAGQVMGNVRQRPLAEIWGRSTVGDNFRALSKGSFVAGQCTTCPYRALCNRCAALSMNETGKLTGYSAQGCQKTFVRWTEVARRAAELGLESPV